MPNDGNITALLRCHYQTLAEIRKQYGIFRRH